VRVELFQSGRTLHATSAPEWVKVDISDSAFYWNVARFVLVLLCALISGAFAVRWASKRIPAESTPRRFVQAMTVAGGAVGTLLGAVIGAVGGSDIGGAVLAIPFHFWLGVPEQVAWFIGMLLFTVAAAGLSALLGASAGYSVGHYLGFGVQWVQRRLR
jgi:hypothetical protein